MSEPAAEPSATQAPVEMHHHHRDVTGGWLRPAVFGVMDGLVSNFALVAGASGGDVTRHVVILVGLAGLAAGAFSMAVGEFTSVASQSDLALAELEIERREIARNPKGERAELAAVYEARGVSPELAAEVARQLSKDPETALLVHAREELGIDPHDLPSPLLAAGSSFVSFAVGAILPVVPYLIGASILWPSMIVAGVSLVVVGTVVALITARPWWYGASRLLLLGAAAAAVTYGVGSAVGAGVG